VATLRDLGPEPFELAPFELVPLAAGPGGEMPVTAPADRWVVLVRGDRAATAVAPGGTLRSGVWPPEILVAAADLDQAAAFKSAAFREFSDAAALVLTEPGSAAIAGVVPGGTLARAMLRGAPRASNGARPGDSPSTPLISRSCQFYEGPALCGTPMQFPGRPSSTPPCPNERGLPRHFFDW
jgi:hypothetical protein